MTEMLNPQLQKLLTQNNSEAIHDWPTDEARKEYKRIRAKYKEITAEVAKIEDAVIRKGDQCIPIRLYEPVGDGPFPVLVYFHGGGWVLGDLEIADCVCRYLSNEAKCVVVSVDYRLAPEHKFPAAAEDAYAATRWVINHAAQINGDPQKVGVAGDSAGGNLAAVVALMLRDQGGPRLVCQLLVYPITQCSFDTPSYQEFATGLNLTQGEMAWFINSYSRSEEDKQNPYLSPLLAESLEGLPTALVVTAHYDPLRDEGERYGERLRAAGVPVYMKRYEGMTHSFINMTGELQEAVIALKETAAELRNVFAGNVPKP